MRSLVRSLGLPSDHVSVASTTDNEDAACAQIVGPITSVYRWEGEVQTEQEWRLEIKTATDRVTALAEHIKANHSYDVPEIDRRDSDHRRQRRVPVLAGGQDARLTPSAWSRDAGKITKRDVRSP